MNLNYRYADSWADTVVAAKTKTLDFDDVDVTAFAGADFMPVGYGGLTWSDTWVVMDPNQFAADTPRSGYFTGVTSGTQVAWNNGGAPLEITAKKFDLLSFNLTSAWDKKMDVDIVAYKKGEIVYDETFSVNDKAPTFIELNLMGIDRITFEATEIKLDPKSGGSGTFMVFDDMEFGTIKSLNAAFVTEGHGSAPIASTLGMDTHFAAPMLDAAHLAVAF